MADKRTDTDPMRDLAPFFAAAQNEADATDAVPQSLLARVLADAKAAQPAPVDQDAPPVVHVDRKGRSGLFSLLGGWPAAAGLAAVMAVGVLVGYSPPAAVFDTATEWGLVNGQSTSGMLAAYDAAFLIDG